jgi:hypothetical protein
MRQSTCTPGRTRTSNNDCERSVTGVAFEAASQLNSGHRTVPPISRRAITTAARCLENDFVLGLQEHLPGFRDCFAVNEESAGRT